MKIILQHKCVSIPLLAFIIVCSTACRKYLEIPAPDNQLIRQTVFNDNKTATAAQLAIYSQMEGESFLYNLTLYAGLSSDEFSNYNSASSYVDLATNNLGAENGLVLSLWTRLYKYIYEANSVLEGLQHSTGVSPEVNKQLSGEALVIRGLCHFYLVNLFGNVPLVLSTDYRINSKAERTLVTVVYSQIIADFKLAQNMLPEQYLSATNTISNDRVRPNKWTAAALLARVYLYNQQWAEAEATSSSVIMQSSTYSLVSNLNAVFLKSSPEAIWQLLPVIPGFNTTTGGYLILTTTPGTAALSPYVFNQFSISDQRRSAWTKPITVGSQTYYYPYKYKAGQNTGSISEYTILLRLAEQYLVRAEARAQAGDLAGAGSDLNLLRSRAGLAPVGALSKPEMLDSIYKERFRELLPRTVNAGLTSREPVRQTALCRLLKVIGIPLISYIPFRKQKLTAIQSLRKIRGIKF